MKRTLSIAAMITLGAAASMPLPSIAQVGLSLVINAAPPAPRFESVPAARRGYVWAPGYWNWDGARHTWLPGHWEGARDGYPYQSGQWQRDDGGYQSILIAPPAPRYERIPRARDGYIWQPGYWDWRANRYQWNSGIWIAERAGYDYARPNWVQRDGRWSMEPPHWSARGRDRDRDGIPDRMEHGRDRDHDGVPDRFERKWRHDQNRDGVPNRYDHDRDGDGVRNRRDGDRDGDGVRNERDVRPDNPRRN